jgi:predicted CxxxxCH...CXXCH cytochrome family protein
MTGAPNVARKGRVHPPTLAFTVAIASGACSLDRAAADAPATGTHQPGVMNPRSGEWHGRVLSRRAWLPMTDSDDPGACGLCHEGVPRPGGVRSSAPGATPCTDCHTEPGGVLACSTCHASPAGAHASHTDPSLANLACATCHPTPGDPVISGLHADGAVEIVFDPGTVGRERSFDKANGTCAVSCHDRGGARTRPEWSAGAPMACGDCHGAPPAGHVSGPCTNCHGEVSADGTALTSSLLHGNGLVDVGDGSGRCGACHGSADDPWPGTAAHPSHRAPELTTAIECGECHVVPATLHAPGHLDGVVQVVFGRRASSHDTEPDWDGARCNQVACHGAGLEDAPAVVPVWSDTTGAASACGACHGAPPSNHTASTSCDRSTCHGSEVTRDASGRLGITSVGKGIHIDGTIGPSP